MKKNLVWYENQLSMTIKAFPVQINFILSKKHFAFGRLITLISYECPTCVSSNNAILSKRSRNERNSGVILSLRHTTGAYMAREFWLWEGPGGRVCVQCGASPLSRRFVLIFSPGYQFACTVAAVSAQRPLEHVKNALQNIANVGTPQSVHF